MSKIELIMPKMGESVAEATIIKWVKKIGNSVELDETIVEIATDKVDSEIPSIAKGILIEQFYQENDIVEVGKVIALIDDGSINTNEQDNFTQHHTHQNNIITANTNISSTVNEKHDNQKRTKETLTENNIVEKDKENQIHFFSPLVKNIAKKEGVSKLELETIDGSGKNGRVTKHDLLEYINNNKKQIESHVDNQKDHQQKEEYAPSSNLSADTEIIQMDRMRKLIAKHMIASKSISAHVTSFVEADVSRIVEWRNRIKKRFLEREGQKITYTPIIFEATIKAIKDFPLINISVDGDQIIKHKNIHLGMATALASGNLIVPVIKKAQEKNILGLTSAVNDLAQRARNNQLHPDEVSGGTFTITNVGSFGSIMGTPIINQPQVAILALGKIQKKATVIETEFGDTIGIRSKMFLSLSYDHRVIDGALGSQFLKRVADYLESFDTSREI